MIELSFIIYSEISVHRAFEWYSQCSRFSAKAERHWTAGAAVVLCIDAALQCQSAGLLNQPFQLRQREAHRLSGRDATGQCGSVNDFEASGLIIGIAVAVVLAVVYILVVHGLKSREYGGNQIHLQYNWMTGFNLISNSYFNFVKI